MLSVPSENRSKGSHICGESALAHILLCPGWTQPGFQISKGTRMDLGAFVAWFSHLGPVAHDPLSRAKNFSVAGSPGIWPGEMLAFARLQGTLLIHCHALNAKNGPLLQSCVTTCGRTPLPLTRPPPVGSHTTVKKMENIGSCHICGAHWVHPDLDSSKSQAGSGLFPNTFLPPKDLGAVEARD